MSQRKFFLPITAISSRSIVSIAIGLLTQVYLSYIVAMKPSVYLLDDWERGKGDPPTICMNS